jgi:hypothetical protein
MPLDTASFQLQNTIAPHTHHPWLRIFASSEQDPAFCARKNLRPRRCNIFPQKGREPGPPHPRGQCSSEVKYFRRHDKSEWNCTTWRIFREVPQNSTVTSLKIIKLKCGQLYMLFTWAYILMPSSWKKFILGKCICPFAFPPLENHWKDFTEKLHWRANTRDW